MKAHKGYSLQKGPSATFPIISFSLNSERPEAFLPKVERDLKKKAFVGKVLVDTLACNGLTSRRFFVGEFDGEHLKRSSFKVLSLASLDTVTQEFCARFYASHFDELERSILAPVQRFKLKRDASHLATGSADGLVIPPRSIALLRRRFALNLRRHM
ncbi:type II toxin-antitoxin system RnlB family antitoxin [Caballeronia sp. GAWG2-1]|uniref:type II toxin-antitoxin system RnlB family antitoxin n=1 Tax=Caballeronia sp. GAWG2-1 TaxID=2921744 RepID=UPI0020280613|nr:type II toxin-antitoxin system RnlB family antitoxin [Caballeronia sp. GAWG2-1]